MKNFFGLRDSCILKAFLNTRFFVFILLSLVFFITLNLFVSFFDFEGIRKFTVYFRRMADAMFFALPVFFLYRKRYLFPYIVLFNLYVLTNIWYYRNYGTIMPLTSYLLVENLHGLGPSIINSMRLKDIWLILPSICFFIYYVRCKRDRDIFKLEWKWLLVSIFVISSAILPYYVLPMREGQQYPTPIDFYRHEVVNACYLYGFVNYWVFQYMFLQGCDESEINYANEFIKEHRIFDRNDSLLVRNTGKNLILVIVESLQTWPMNVCINGKEVTPNLNRIVDDENVLFLPKVLPQVSGGRSADAQLMLNTGLLPIKLGAVATLYATNRFIALPRMLSAYGYSSAILLCDDKAYWNQETTSMSYGFGKIYDKLNHEIIYKSDEVLFREAIPLLKEMTEPFYAQLVTYSGHDPVDTDFNSWINDEKFVSDEVRNSLKITEYEDKCIGKFIEELKTCGLYDNSIIIITGDHDGVTFNKYESREKCLLEDRFVPFIVLNSSLRLEETGNVVGQSDLFPTLLDIMGVKSSYRGLGESIFRNQDNCAIYHTGEYCGGCKNDSIIEYKRSLWTISDILIRMDYLNKSENIKKQIVSR